MITKKSERNFRQYIIKKKLKEQSKYYNVFSENLDKSTDINYMLFKFTKLCYEAKSYYRILNRLSNHIDIIIRKNINLIKNILESS